MKYFVHKYNSLVIYVPVESISDNKAMENVDLYGSSVGISIIIIKDGEQTTQLTTNEVLIADDNQFYDRT